MTTLRGTRSDHTASGGRPVKQHRTLLVSLNTSVSGRGLVLMTPLAVVADARSRSCPFAETNTKSGLILQKRKEKKGELPSKQILRTSFGRTVFLDDGSSV